MSQIETAVDMKRGALYHHIGNKEALLFEICRTQVDAMIASAEEILQTTEDPDQQLRQVARRLLRNIVEHRAEWTVFYRDYHALTDDRLAALVERRERFELLVAGMVERGVKSGMFWQIDPVATKGILGALNLTYTWLTPDGRLSPEDVADIFVDLFIEGLRVRSRTEAEHARA